MIHHAMTVNSIAALISEFVVFSLVWTNFGGLCQDFGYDGDEGPIHWGDKYAQCIGKHQSPIDIETNNVSMKTFPPLTFEYFEVPLDVVGLENNGHTVTLKVISEPTPRIQGGPLAGVYKFRQLHFHWGPNDTVGSENLINHHSFPLELHMVMYKEEYKEFEKAADVPSGLTVLSFLISVSASDNPNYDKFEDGLQEVRQLSSITTLHDFVSLNELSTKERRTYFTYEGSLTTPPCSEVVTWIEFVETIPLSREQINAFRSLSTKNGSLTHNYRPIQPINDRIIFYNGANVHRKENAVTIAISLCIIRYMVS